LVLVLESSKVVEQASAALATTQPVEHAFYRE
jgi:hypothetical protein